MRRLVLALIVTALAGWPRVARGDLARIWAVSDGTKLSASDGDHPLAAGNEIFDSAQSRVDLFGLGNETVAFQLVVVGGGSDTAVRVELGSMGEIRNGSVSDDPDRYYLDRHIEIFEAPTVSVTERSHDIVWQPGSDAEPDGPTGDVTDPLVPHRREVVVPAGAVRIFWIDVWIPRDARPGTHSGELVVTTASGDAACPPRGCTVAVHLEVADLEMPERAATRTMLWYSGGERDARYVLNRYFAVPEEASEAERRALRRRHHHLARRHRVSLFWGKHERPDTEVLDLVSGRAFSRNAGYDGPGTGLGVDVFAFRAYGGELSSAEAESWAAWFRAHGRTVETFLYTRDEPPDRPDVIAEVNRRAAAAEPIDAFVTNRYDPRFDVDIFAVPAWHYGVFAAVLARASGRRSWIYNGKRPHSGTFAIDDVAISPRVNPWIQDRYDIPRWFYWEATYYLDFQGERGPIDVWSTAQNFSNRHGDRVNGDGLLFYPGRDHLFPESDRGIDRPLPSIRLKNWRRGIEDVEYLQLARAMGHGELAEQIARSLVPRALDRVRRDDPVAWPQDGERWIRARRLLFDALRGAPRSGIDLSSIRRPEEPLHARAARWLRRTFAPFVKSPLRRIVSGAAALAALAAMVLFVRRRRRTRRT